MIELIYILIVAKTMDSTALMTINLLAQTLGFGLMIYVVLRLIGRGFYNFINKVKSL